MRDPLSDTLVSLGQVRIARAATDRDVSETDREAWRLLAEALADYPVRPSDSPKPTEVPASSLEWTERLHMWNGSAYLFRSARQSDKRWRLQYAEAAEDGTLTWHETYEGVHMDEVAPLVPASPASERLIETIEGYRDGGR